MKGINREKAMEYAIVPKNPVIIVDPGEKFAIETEDSYNGRIRTKDQLSTLEFLPELASLELNPLGGPVYVRRAEKGDVLIVNIIDIIPDEQGVTCFIPGEGPLADSASWSECQGPFTHIVKHVLGVSGTTTDGNGVFSRKITWHLKPSCRSVGC